MKMFLMATAAVAVLAWSSPEAEAIGCPGGAAAGAAAGHFVGSGHAVLGGIAGCVVGHHHKKKEEKKEREDQMRQQQNNDRSRDGRDDRDRDRDR